jgi:alanine dehydrogenase
MKTDSSNFRIVFTSISEPNLIEMKDVTRSELNTITFTFTKINSLEVEIFIEAILIPETAAPKWMMRAWFPDGPAGTLKRFKELAENL